MFDFVHENKRVVQVILLVIVLPFALWGVNSYRESGGGKELASVDGEKVSAQEFENAVAEKMEEMKRMTGGKVDQAMFDRPEVRQAILSDLVKKKLLLYKARTAGVLPTDEELAQFIAQDPGFQQDGKFSKEKYDTWLKVVLDKQGMSKAVVESRLREGLAAQQLKETFSQNGHVSDTATDNLIRLIEQQRVVTVAQISTESMLSQVKVDDEAVRKHYEANQTDYAVPERARVEYVEFSAKDLVAQETADANEIKDYYERHQDAFSLSPEQRQASHILIMTQGMDADKKKAAREKAESILKEVKQAPAKFAELAKAQSEDPGSKDKGGDLGFFGRGMMTKPFEDAVFSLKAGEISGLVETSFGYHIIRLAEIKPAKVKPLQEAKAEVANQVKLEKAREKFAKLEPQFDETAYQQSDSLKPAADLVKAAIKQSGWLQKGQRPTAPWTEKVLQAVFSESVLKKKRNSSAVEVGQDTVVVVRLLDYKAASVQPLAEVGADIRKRLMQRAAHELALKKGKEAMEKLQRGEAADIKWGSEKHTLSRAKPAAGVAPELGVRIMRADTAKLPAFAGAETAQGYVLARIESVQETGPIDDGKRMRFAQMLYMATGEELLQASMAHAYQQAKVNMHKFVEDGSGK